MAKTDVTLQELKQVMQEGCLERKRKLDPCVKPFYDARDEFAVLDHVIFKADRVIAPKGIRERRPKIAHEGQDRIVQSKHLA